MKLKYYYIAALFVIIATGGYFFGKGMYSESVTIESVETVPSIVVEPGSAMVETENLPSAPDDTIAGPFPADILPPEALLGTSSEPQ